MSDTGDGNPSGFGPARDELAAGRAGVADAEAVLAAARNAATRAKAAEAAFARRLDPNDAAHLARRRELERERREAAAAAAAARAHLDRLRKVTAGLHDRFAEFSDPRTGIGALDDSIPILMMPVRVETRFMTSALEPGTEPRAHLAVRIYPDDCWIDTFDPELTAGEYTDARNYWIARWQAGGIEEQHRGAWRSLAAAHGSGRAAWVREQHRPVDLSGEPSKLRPQDVVLTIVVDADLPDAEVEAVETFWCAAWRADGAAEAHAAAVTALEADVGAGRAVELIATTTPTNFATSLAAGTTKAEVGVSAAFLRFPPAAPKPSAWARAPRVEIMPDRFVFVGYSTPDDTSPQVVVGAPTRSPLVVGPDPSLPPDEQFHFDADGNLVIPEELRWTTDFERALEVGMGMVVPLDAPTALRGFHRVLVVGLRLSADAPQSQAELETLLSHHAHRRTGIAVLAQGTPTNNTEATPSGRGLDDPDASFDNLSAPLFTDEPDWLSKRDGQWLAEYLGVNPAVFAHVPGAGGRDQTTARAMNALLWPATLGYWMESMLSPVFTPDAVDATHEFATRFVIGAGACPALRIGEQPYGILPATALSRTSWFLREPGLTVHAGAQDGLARYLRRLYPVLVAIDADFRSLQDGVAHVGAAGDPHALMLDVLGLHSGSVEWAQRYAESLATLFNRLNLLGSGGFALVGQATVERAAARLKLSQLGYPGDTVPSVLDLSFSGRHNELRGGVVDDVPLSETDPVRAYTPDGRNYLRWLIDAANTSLDALYTQRDFTDGKHPTALLYLLARHALQLGYADVSVRLHEAADLYTPGQAVLARRDDPFIHVRDNQLDSESRYFPLYHAAPVITGSSDRPVHEFIALNLPHLEPATYLRTQVRALEHLADRPTAQLERAFADHIDTCSYRLDAWLLGIVNAQLALMRNLQEQREGPARRGIHLGAYAWLEPLRPDGRALRPAHLSDDADLADAFAGAMPLLDDPVNQGFIHAPSINHGIASAVLRNGYLSNASPANRRTMAVNLTSERVRTALGLIEGIRNGQSLGSLLGYQFERGLHDAHGLAEVDKFIYKLRKAFPLASDHFASTKTEEGVAIESIEARNVIDGLALVEHMRATGNTSYKFGHSELPDASPQEQVAIDAEAERLLAAHDAVADLALAEGVYQAVLGNYDRVASTYDAYARGNFPPEPDIVRTPLNGIGITHRLALHLEPDLDPAVSPVPGMAMTPRAQAEPALNGWLAAILPPPADVGCQVTYRDATTGAEARGAVDLDRLGLQPIDIVAIIRDDEQAMTELDDRVVRFARASFPVRPDGGVRIDYVARVGAPCSVFELMPLVRNLRHLTTGSRCLQPTDLAMMNEATNAPNTSSAIDPARLIAVRAAMQGLAQDIDTFLPSLRGPLADLTHRRGELLAHVDTHIDTLVDLLAAAARFGVAQAGSGFAVDFQARTFSAILAQADDLTRRWQDRLTEFDARRAVALGAATDDERLLRLGHAQQAISTVPTTPYPATPAVFDAILTTVMRPAFVARRAEFAALASTTRRTVNELLDDVRALLPVDAFDPVPFQLVAHEDAIVTFSEDAKRVLEIVRAELGRRLSWSQSLLDEHDASVAPDARLGALDGAAKALLGEDFRVVPEFTLAQAHVDELANAVAASTSGDLFDYLDNPSDPGVEAVEFPVDEWLYGVARVRPKAHAWEQVVMHSGALNPAGGEPELLPIQLPHVHGDRWLGLEFPSDMPLDTDRLLYTAHHAVPFGTTARHCGLLLDEWTETIPTETVDTGIAFHHDRPSNEAPQAMLLVTPTDFRGAWRWDDLVDALNETLDLAKRRAVEPDDLDATPYAPYLPATVVATQVHQLTIAAEFALNNKIASAGEG